METFIRVMILVGVLGLFLLLLTAVRKSDKADINKWATEKRYSVVKIEETIIDLGPFWLKDDDDRLYRVEIKDELEQPKVAYFRFRLFGYDQEWWK